MTLASRKSLPLRWLQFNAVGVAGFGLQLVLLALLHHGLGWHYLVATAVAVELTVLHNYVWHERWTWKDRSGGSSSRELLRRLLVFNISNGAISLMGNILLMRLLVQSLGLPVLPANIAAILACSLVNFAASHYLVFRRRLRRPSEGLPGFRVKESDPV